MKVAEANEADSLHLNQFQVLWNMHEIKNINKKIKTRNLETTEVASC